MHRIAIALVVDSKKARRQRAHAARHRQEAGNAPQVPQDPERDLFIEHLDRALAEAAKVRGCWPAYATVSSR